MGTLLDLSKALGIFLAGFFALFICNQILDSLIPSLNGVSSNPDLFNGLWFAIILVWVVTSLFVPTYFVYAALQQSTKNHKFTNVMLGLLTFLLTSSDRDWETIAR